MRRVIFNLKGGVGKSTITCNLAALSAQKGKTLIIDLDPQGNATQYVLGESANAQQKGVAHFFEQVLDLSLNHENFTHFIHPTPFENLYIMPASPKLAKLLSQLEQSQKLYKLRQFLDSLEGFDSIYFDTPPALNFFTKSALIAGECCLVPFDCDLFAQHAIFHLVNGIQEIQETYHEKIYIKGIIVNQFSGQAQLPKKMVKELEDHGLPVIPHYVSSSVKIKESHDKAKPMIYLSPSHKITQEFKAIDEWLLAPSHDVEEKVAAENAVIEEESIETTSEQSQELELT